MRFIVDLYRYIVFIALAAAIIVTVFGLLEVSKLTDGNSQATGLYVAGFLAALVVLILALGITATFISIHDRHAELVDELRGLREDLRG